MFCVRWAEKFSHFPKEEGNPSSSANAAGNPAELTRKPNFAVHDFMNAVLRHEPSAIPQTMNRYFRQVTHNTDQPLFATGDISNAILRWYESCPTAAAYFRAHLTGPILFRAEFLRGCEPEITDAFAAVWQDGFRQALDYVRMRVYMVQVRRHPQWTFPAEARRLKKSDIRKIEVDQTKIIQYRQVVLTDTWGDKFMTDLRPDVQVRQLSGLAHEAVKSAKDLFLGHTVERIYIFWGRDELFLGPGQVSDHLYSLSKHFATEFPYVQCFLVLPPYVYAKHESHRANVKRILDHQVASFANVTLVWFPTDEQLSDLFEAARRQNTRPAWPTALQSADGNPSDAGIRLRKAFWEQRYDVTLWLHDGYDREQALADEAASLEAIHDMEQQQQPPPPPPSDQPPNAEDDSSAMDHEQSHQGPADTEGNPSVADIPLPAQEEPPRTRSSTAESSSVEILERDESPGVLSNFSLSPAPGPTADVVTMFQHFLAINTSQPSLQPRITKQALAVLYPFAGQDILDKLWDDYQKVMPTFYAVQQAPAEAVEAANAASQHQPREEQFDAHDEDARAPDSTTESPMEASLHIDESRVSSAASSPPYEALPDDYQLKPEDERVLADLDDEGVLNAHLEALAPTDLEERFDALTQRPEGQSPQPMEESEEASGEARQSEPPSSTAEEATGGTTDRSTSQTSDPYIHDGPAGSDDW
ncbi:hypothetical protein AAVH_39164 [Aphelenchoides avenae]|nr:hypothetical protein AAVH_39164 [Aphelenchus avenae]